MAHISSEHYQKMKRAYRADIALYLAFLARKGVNITYAGLTAEFGGNHRMWGDPLGGIAIRCRERGLPILSVLVVTKDSGRPSDGAVLYKDLGLNTPAEIDAEVQRCYSHDWPAEIFG